MYPRRGSGPLLKPELPSIAEVMKSAGYGTALSGKWHLGSRAPRRPIDRGFDDAYGLWDGCCNFFDPAQRDPPFKGSRRRHFSDNGKRITEFPDGFYTTDAFTDHAIGCVKRFAGEKTPFFVHVCYTAPHYPLHAFPEDIAKYDGRYDDGWEALRRARHARVIELGLMDPKWRLPDSDSKVKPWANAKNKEWNALRMETYAAMIDRMDQNIGRLLKALDDAGVADNTLVMFLSDNGGCAETPGGNNTAHVPGPKEHYAHCGPGWAFASNTPFRRFKQWVHEGGIATPLIARWPGRVEPGTMNHAVGHIIDFLPTLADVGGAEIPGQVDGKSLVPVLDGKTREGHDRLFWSYGKNRAIREGKWKLVTDRQYGRWELYDLATDRTETNDLAAKHPERVKSMAATWTAWAVKTGVAK
jgi:arylsulfatase